MSDWARHSGYIAGPWKMRDVGEVVDWMHPEYRPRGRQR